MADLVPQGEVQDAHSRSPRNFATMKKEEKGALGITVSEAISRMNEKDQEPETVGGKNPYEMSPNELRKLVK